MASKWKKRLKKVGKAAAIAAALYGATKLGRGGKKSVADTAATEGIKWTPGVGGKQHFPTSPEHWNTYPETFAQAKDGGRIGAKKGGRVKSMGIAKRGGGAAKR